MDNFYVRMKEGLEEIVAHKQGKISLYSEVIEIPEPLNNKGLRRAAGFLANEAGDAVPR
jgi:hypothetical protein